MSVGLTVETMGQPAEAVRYYRQALAVVQGLKKPRAVDVYDQACCHSLLSGVATQPGSGLTADPATAEAEQAVACIRRAFEAGYNNLVWVRSGDAALKPIRSRPDFQALMTEFDKRR